MRHRILHLMCVVVLMSAAYAQQSHWATPDDKAATFMIDMERKWAEGVCTNNGVISELLADDFQGTSTRGERYNKADELRDEKGTHSAHGCGVNPSVETVWNWHTYSSMVLPSQVSSSLSR